MPSIDVYISTSTPLLDLTSTTPLVITIDLILDHTHPITLHRHKLCGFEDLRSYRCNFTFTDTATGKPLSRSLMCLFTESRDPPTFSWRTRDSYVTLRPGEKYTLTAAFEPHEEKPWYIQDPKSNMTKEEVEQIKEKLMPVTQWQSIGGFQNGKTYEIGLSTSVIGSGWVEGSKTELLSLWSYVSSFFGGRVEKKDKIPLDVMQTARFTVKRPEIKEENDRITWPVMIGAHHLLESLPFHEKEG